VVQLFVKSSSGNIEKPEKELKGFAKTNLLGPEEIQVISMYISSNDLGYYDTELHFWKLDQGTYEFMVATDSKNPKLGSSLILKDKIIKQTQQLLAPKVTINELSIH